jgi:HD-GYP domain-containing protein (c-di-GMP phosphodiesterase class II)
MRAEAPSTIKERRPAADSWAMPKSRPFARPGHAARRAAGRRLVACSAPVVRRGASPDRLTRELAERVPRMAGHHRAVAGMAGAVARQIGLTGERLHAVVRAAELHDVGKVLVPDAILNKPGPLDAAELELMRRHAVAGYLILTEAGEPAPVPALVRSSHERWDGSGYPDGLAGEDIPMAARVFAVADALDALTTDRPYRPAGTFAQAREVIVAGAGSQFCPSSVQALQTVSDERFEDLRGGIA